MVRPAASLLSRRAGPATIAACPRCSSRPVSFTTPNSIARASRNRSFSFLRPSTASLNPTSQFSHLSSLQSSALRPQQRLRLQQRQESGPCPQAQQRLSFAQKPRSFSTSSSFRAATPVPEPGSEISVERYHELADEYLDEVDTQFADKAEQDTKYELEFSSGVLTVSIEGQGTYVINKQPPNKQIWLSSPISGPKRYDFVDGQWVYSRDGTTLSGLLKDETGVELPERQD